MRGFLLGLAIVGLLIGIGLTTSQPDESGAARPAGPRPAAVIVAAVQHQQFSDAIEALGTTRALESVDLSPTVTERVSEILFADGSYVEAGQLLIRLDDAVERAELAAARARKREKFRKLERVGQLLEQRNASAAELDIAVAELDAASAAVELAEAALLDRSLRAPFAGHLGLRRFSVGALVQPGDVLITIDAIATLNVDFTVPASRLAGLEASLPLRVRSAAFPGHEFQAELSAIGTQVDPVTRSLNARAILANADLHLRPGMFVELEILAARRDSLAVPESAILARSDQRLLFIHADGLAQRRVVETGSRRNGMVEVIRGISAGEEVVIHGGAKLSDRQSVDVIAVHDGTATVAELLRKAAR